MPFTVDMAIVIGVSVIALILFAFEVLAPDLVALFAVLAVLVTGVVEPAAALSGFANPAVHTIAAMFVVSAGLLKTGVVESFGRQLIRLGGHSPALMFLLTLVSVVVLSAFINNTPIVIMMIPVSLGLARAHGVAPSKLLIPISFASIFGGCCTLIGTSTNLVVSGMATQAGLRPLSMFELTAIGLPLAALGVVYLLVFSRRLLPEREPVTSNVEGGSIREYVTEMVVQEGSTLVGKPLGESRIGRSETIRILQVIRGEQILWPPLTKLVLRADDILIAKGSADGILGAGRKGDLHLVPDLGGEPLEKELTLAEVVIARAPSSRGRRSGRSGSGSTSVSPCWPWSGTAGTASARRSCGRASGWETSSSSRGRRRPWRG
jgi:di/tricarboxylate transporter